MLTMAEIGVKTIRPDIFLDHRGKYVEIFNVNNSTIDFKQDDISVSYYGVLRGIHGDESTWKLISCLKGHIYVIVVCMDADSEHYKKWASCNISEENYMQLLVPPRYGIGHLVLSDSAIFWYKQSTQYNRETQFTIKWNNPDYDFWWPIHDPITSQRDE